MYNCTVINKSRKEHKCEECRRLIPKGSSYVKIFAVNEGYVWKAKRCLDCYKLCEELYSYRYSNGCYIEDAGHTWGELLSELREMYKEDPDAAIFKSEEWKRYKESEVKHE